MWLLLQVNELLVLQPAAPLEWMATQLQQMGESWAVLHPPLSLACHTLRYNPSAAAAHLVDLPVLARPPELQQRLVVAETAAECEAAVRGGSPFCLFLMKTDHSPRQARDKHSTNESSTQMVVSLAGGPHARRATR